MIINSLFWFDISIVNPIVQNNDHDYPFIDPNDTTFLKPNTKYGTLEYDISLLTQQVC
jgi:hypothetical protein